MLFQKHAPCTLRDGRTWGWERKCKDASPGNVFHGQNQRRCITTSANGSRRPFLPLGRFTLASARLDLPLSSSNTIHHNVVTVRGRLVSNPIRRLYSNRRNKSRLGVSLQMLETIADNIFNEPPIKLWIQPVVLTGGVLATE